MRARILLVDDNERNLIATSAILEPLRHEVKCVTSGRDALKALLSEEFAVILLDVQMPGMSGFETATIIKSRERTSYIPIIFLTAHDSAERWADESYARGGVDFLRKPVDPAMLRAKVQVFVELWRRGQLLEQRGRALERAQHAEGEARRMAEFEQQLVGIVSHDIRSPLSAIKATAATLLMDVERDTPQERALRRVCRGANRIEQLTNLLLDFTRSRLSGGISVYPRPTDMRDVLRAVVDESSAAHPGRAILAHFDDGDGLGQWDPSRLHQLLANLVDNAVKYGAPATEVTVSARLTGPTVRLEVHNDGPAIRADQIPVLFEPFARGQHGNKHAKVSLGLGLYIVKAIAQAHGGDVSVTSSEREGTTFTVTLPREAHERPPRRGEGSAAPSR